MDRVIYASNTVLMSDSPGFDNHTGLFYVKLLDRVQDASVSVSTEVKRLKHLGYEDHLFENYYPNSNINCEISFYNSDSSNESIIGFPVDDKSIFYNQLAPSGDRNIFLLSDNVGGRDIARLTGLTGVYVFGIGNAIVTNYSVRGSLGSLPMTTVSFAGKNICFDTYTGQNSIPSLNNGIQSNKYYSFTSGIFDKTNYVSDQNLRPLAIRPADIFVTMSQPSYAGGIYQTVTGKLQNFQIDIPFPRKELIGFGQNHVFDRKLLSPAVGTVSFNALFEQPQNVNYSGIFDFSNGKTIDIELKDCSGNAQLRYRMENTKLISENFNFAIGPQVNFDGSFQFEVTRQKGFKISGVADVYDDDAFNFLQAANISDTTIRSSVNSFVEDLKYYGLWSKMSGVYPFVGGNSGSHKLNLKNSSNSDSAFRLGFSGTGTQHLSSGVYFSGTGDYANTYFNPYSHLSGNPVHISALFLSDEDSASAEIGCISVGGGNPRLSLVAESSSFGGAIFDCYDFTTGRCIISGSLNSQAFYTASRTSNSGEHLLMFRNSTTPTQSKLQTGNISGLQKPNYNIFVGAVNASGTPQYANASNRRFGFLSFGDGLTSGECVQLYTVVKDFQTSLGRNSQVFV